MNMLNVTNIAKRGDSRARATIHCFPEAELKTMSAKEIKFPDDTKALKPD